MLSSIISSLESFIMANGSWAVFLGCILEQIIVPIPASLIVISSSFVIMKGVSLSLNSITTLIVRIAIPASLGITLGSLFYYYLVYKFEKPFIQRTGKYLGVSIEDVEDVERKFKESRYDVLFLFLARCFPVIPSIAINLFCGLIRYDLKKYLLTTFFGSLVQITGWALLAWLSGNIYQLLEDKLGLLGDLVTVIIILVVAYYIIKKRRERNKSKLNDLENSNNSQNK